MIRWLVRLFVILIALLGVYHLLIYCSIEEIIPIEKQLVYPVHNIAMNSIGIVLLTHLIKSCILSRKFYWCILYFGIKIVYNILLYTPLKIIQNYLNNNNYSQLYLNGKNLIERSISI